MPRMNRASSVPHPRITVALLLLLSLSLAPVGARAADLYKVGMALTERLMRAELYDYALLSVEQLLRDFPDRREAVQIRKAEILYKLGRRKDATALLEQIPADSRFHYDAVRVQAMLMAGRETDKAIELFNEYFENAPVPPERDRAGRAEYVNTLRTFAGVLMREKDPRAADVLKKIQKLGGDDGTDKTDRRGRFIQAKLTLEAQPDKNPDRKAVQNALEEFANLKYGDDMISALSYVQRVRALLMLGKVDQALKLIDSSKSYIAKFDRALRKQGQADASPLVGLFYYWGRALTTKALQHRAEGDDAKAKDVLIAAAKRCRMITKNYPDAAEYPAKATVLFENIRRVLKEAYGIDLGWEEGGENTALLESKLEEGDAFLQDGNYAKAAEALLEGIKAAPRSNVVPRAGVRLAVCYAQQQELLKAQAVCLYLRDVFPDYAETIDSFLKIGSVLYQKGKSASGEDAQEAMEDAALMWGHFLQLDPTHTKAQDIAYAIAEHMYGKARDAAKKSREIKDPQAKKDRKSTRLNSSHYS